MEAKSAIPKYNTGILFGSTVFLCLYITSRYSYLLFHNLAELFSIVVAAGVFMIAWHSRGLYKNSYIQFLSIAYLFVAGVDVLHTLSYKGMGVFPEYGNNLPTQLWIGARYMQAISLVIAPFLINRKLRYGYTFFAFGLAMAIMLISIFYWNIFPECFNEQLGLTTFKKASEYIISLLFLVSVILLVRKQEEFDPEVVRLIAASIIVTIFSELCFTLYTHVYGIQNLLGHFLEIVAFYLLYRGIIKVGLEEPTKLLFRNLKLSEENLRQAHEKLELRVLERTAELEATNRELGREIENRKKIEENLRDVSNRLLKAQEGERRHLALDLHDSIGGSLLGVKMALEQKLDDMKNARTVPDGIALESILELVRTCMTETGRIQQNLRPALLDHLGLMAALRSLCREFGGTHREIKTNCTLEVDEKDVPEDLKIIVYRISQEALNNVAKHSSATSVNLSLIHQQGGIQLTIRDDGCGFDAENGFSMGERRGGIGLSSMKERCELSSGAFCIQTRKDEGTTVSASWLLD